MEIFVARQPIFNTHKKIFGYELLFRNGLENKFPDIDGDTATSNVLSNTFFSFELKELLGNKPGLINFTKKLLLQKAPLLFPQKHVIIEVLETVEPTDAVLAALSEIKKKGFTIALDDFVYHKKFRPMMELCRIIKFDLITTPLDTLVDIVQDIRSNLNITLLAEKVETYEEFQKAKEMGFMLFQGYFFSRPEILSKKGISSVQTAKIRLINEVGQPELNLNRIETLIKNDVSISYRLLKFINSAYFKRPNPINTLKDAITFLGTNELRKFINIVVTSDLCEKKPNELIRQSIIRAGMCEQIGTVINKTYLPEELFTLGLFSLLDAMMDHKMDEILKQIGLSKKMKTALAGNDKGFNQILNMVKLFEQGDWGNSFFTTNANALIEKKLPRFYLDSLKMADSFFVG